MKIGIITQPLENNYGGLLQNYALQEVLRRLGHAPITINQYWPLIPKKKFYIESAKNFIKKVLGRPYKPIIYINDKELKAISVNTQKFIQRHIIHTQRVTTEKEYRNVVIENELKAIIVGSDQVWRPMYNRYLERSFLNFAKGLDIKRLAYAASFGVDTWEYNNIQTSICKELANEFDAISVREESAVGLCKKHLNCDAVFVLDPTMLLDKEDYIDIVESSNVEISKGNLFTYILDKNNEKQECIDKVAKKLNLTPFSVMPAKDKVFIKENIDECVFPAVECWLRAFIDAEFVICDSFHGAVFSIIFNKPFAIIGNKKRGMSRFDSLVKFFSLEDRLIYNTVDIDILRKNIDWKSVNEKRNAMKALSINFIINNLK